MATANEWASGRASRTGGGDINAWASGLAKSYGYDDEYFKKLDAEKARKKALEPKVNSYRDGFFNGAITEEARNGILTSLKKRAETGDELAIERFNAIVGDERINQAAPGIAPNLSGMETLSKGLVEGVASAYTRLGRGTGQTLNQKTGGAKEVERTSQALNTQTVQLINKYGKQLRDPNVSPEQKERIRKSLNVLSKDEQLRNTQIGRDAQQLIDDTDPVKGAAAVAEIGLDIATLGTGGAAIKTAKSGGRVAAGKILRGSLEGAGAGIAGTIQQRGSETTAKDLAIGGAMGAGFGATLPAVGYGLTNAKKAIPSIFDSKFGQAIANTSAGQKISQAKGTMGRIFVDDTNLIKKQFGNDVEVGGTWKVKDRIDNLVTNVRNSGVTADSTLQEDEGWKQLTNMFDGMSKRDGRALKKSLGEFINKKQDAINNNKLVTDGRIEGKLVAVPKGTPEQELAYSALNSSTKPVVQRMFDEGRISKAKYDSWINDGDYTRVQREIDETLGEEFARGGGFSPSAKGVSDQKLKGSTKQAVDPFAAHIDWSRKAQRELEQNKLTKYLRDQSLAKGITKPLRVADKVIQRIELYGEAAQLRPLRNKIGKLVKAQGQYVRRIQSELDKLNKAGLDEALKNGGKEKMPDFTPGGMGGDVPTAKTGKSTTDFVQGTRGTVREPSKQIDRLSKKRDQLINEAESLDPSRKPAGTPEAETVIGGELDVPSNVKSLQLSTDNGGVISTSNKKSALAKAQKLADERGETVYITYDSGQDGLIDLRAVKPTAKAPAKTETLYHGTNVELPEGKPTTGQTATKSNGYKTKSEMVFFSDKKETANFFADNRSKSLGGKSSVGEYDVDTSKVLDFTGDWTQEGMIANLKKLGYGDTVEARNGDITNLFDTKDFKDRLIANGYTGVKFKEKGGVAYGLVDDSLINKSTKTEPLAISADPTRAKDLRAQADKIQKQINDIQRKIQPKAVDAATTPSKLSKAESDRFINSLVEEDPAKLKAIRRKIGNREPKLAQALDEMIALSDEYKTTKFEVNDLIERARSKELADLDPAGEKTMSVFENGIRELYTVDPAVAKQLKSISDTNLGVAGQAFLATSKILRLGATALNAAFAIPNFIMDQTFSFAMSKNKFATHNPIVLVQSMVETAAKPLLRGVNDRVPGARNAFTGLLEPSDAYKAWASKNKYMTRTDLARQLKAATRQSDEMLGVRGEGALRKFEGVISSLEETTRFQNYLGTLKKMAKDKNLSREEIAAMADEASRKNSVNFSSHGEMNQFLQIFNPYINAGVQGAKTLGSSLKERPVSTGLAITATTLLPVGMSTYYNLGDPKRAQIYANIPTRERENNLIFVTDSGAVVKMPIPVSFRPFAKPVRNYIESQFLGDRQGLLETAKNLFLDPFNPLGTTKNEALANTIPQFIKPAVEVGMNKDLYFGSEVVPESLQGLPKEEQAYANTPEIYKTIGKKIGMSPLQLRKLVTGYTAGGGEGALVNIDALRGEETGGRSAAEQVSARFYKSPGNQGTQVKSTFYETYKPLRQKKDAYSGKITDAVKAGDMDKANKMAQMINDEVEKEKERLRTKYGRYETDLTVLYDQMDNLKLPMENGRLTQASIKARSK